MAILQIPDMGIVVKHQDKIKHYLFKRGIHIDKWKTRTQLGREADNLAVLQAYAHVLDIYMKAHSFTTATVISYTPPTSEQNHQTKAQVYGLSKSAGAAPEGRLIVDGEGLFWFDIGNEEPVFGIQCKPGEMFFVPSNTCYWMDFRDKQYIKMVWMKSA